MAGEYLPTFAVLVNRFNRDRYTNNEICDCCGRFASVVNLGIMWACSGCLSQAQEALGKAVLRNAVG